MSENKWGLHAQATCWRLLGKIGMWIHDFPAPKPRVPQFTRRFNPSTAKEDEDGVVQLHFYVTEDYASRMEGARFPVVVNFHGGGFTLGTATDDGRWASVVLQEACVVFVSVKYRLAPTHPFPAAVEDGLEALLYLTNNQEGFGIDASKMILSGFSAGGNMTFSVPLKLQASLESLSTADVDPPAPKLTPRNIPRVLGIISFYPVLDYTIPRDIKRAASVRPDKCLPNVFTDLFDASYLANKDDKQSPFVSPALASDETLNKALPADIVIYLCEWDMLLAEGRDFAERLQRLGKRIDCRVIEEEKHAFDKMPAVVLNPKVALYYREACKLLHRILTTDIKDSSQAYAVDNESTAVDDVSPGTLDGAANVSTRPRRRSHLEPTYISTSKPSG